MAVSKVNEHANDVKTDLANLLNAIRLLQKVRVDLSDATALLNAAADALSAELFWGNNDN